MGHVARLRNHLALLLVVCALAALVFAALLGTAARAEEPTAKDAPAVVRELPERRTAYATCYLLDSGQYRTVFSQSLVHYRDAKGDWQPIDLTPEAQADGSYEVDAAAVPVRFADQAPGSAPVTLETPDGPVSMDLLGGSEDDATSDGQEVSYAEVLPDLDVIYQATGDGVKETLVLASPVAPASYTYRLTHPGFTLKQDESGEWGLYAGKAERPTLCLGGSESTTPRRPRTALPPSATALGSPSLHPRT